MTLRGMADRPRTLSRHARNGRVHLETDWDEPRATEGAPWTAQTPPATARGGPRRSSAGLPNPETRLQIPRRRPPICSGRPRKGKARLPIVSGRPRMFLGRLRITKRRLRPGIRTEPDPRAAQALESSVPVVRQEKAGRVTAWDFGLVQRSKRTQSPAYRRPRHSRHDAEFCPSTLAVHHHRSLRGTGCQWLDALESG